jgi:hypothetical protein
MFVSSKAPANPKQEFGSGPYTLKAESADQVSSASAVVGLDGGGGTALGLSRSHAESGAEGDSVTAVATSETTGVAVGPLRIGRVLSKASTTFGPDGKLARLANTVVEGASVGGTPVVIEKPDLAPVNQLLAQAKIQIDFAPKQEVDTGVTAPMLRITQHDESSGATIIYQIGEASAFVDAALPTSYASAAGDATTAPAPASNESSTEGSTGTEPSPSSPEATATLPAPVTAPAATATLPVPVSFVVSSPPPAAPEATVAPPVPTTEPPTQTIQLAESARPVAEGVNPAARLLFSTSDTTPVFLILTIGAVMGLAIAGFVSRLRTARG